MGGYQRGRNCLPYCKVHSPPCNLLMEAQWIHRPDNLECVARIVEMIAPVGERHCPIPDSCQ
jgi:hypothetical protein